jgi:P4 family phage/plasmid primase-like protien
MLITYKMNKLKIAKPIEPSLSSFLNKHKRNDKPEFTHTIIPNHPIHYGGSYTIPDDKYNLFLDKYHKEVFEFKKEAYLTEKHKDFSPVLIDLDFRFCMDKSSRQYSNEFIRQYLKCYMEEVRKILDVKGRIEIFVLEKTKPKIESEKQLVKDGIHIMIPRIITLPMIQYILRYKMINNEEVNTMLSELGITNSIDDVIDICVIEKNNWQMYGSRKPNCEAYQLTQIYESFNTNLKPIDVNKYDHRKLLDLMSIRNKNKKDLTLIKEDIVEKINQEYSSIPHSQRIKKQQKPVIRQKKKKSPSRINTNFNEHLDKIKKIIDILSKDRAENYNDWQNLGWCLHNIDDRLLPIWIQFSKKSSKFKDGECEQVWPYMDNQGLGLGTLYMWAKEDNPDKYAELTKNDLRKYLFKGLNATTFDIAVVMYQKFKDEFVYAPKKTWYQFTNHRWKTLDEGIVLQNCISTELVMEYLGIRGEYINKANTIDPTDQEFEDNEKQIKKIGAVIKKLKDLPFKKKVMEECQGLFYVEDFELELDVKTKLIGFENGIYDLENNMFRDGISEDYIKFSTKIHYLLDFDNFHPQVQEVRAFLHQILPEKIEREYAIRLLASFLDGEIKGQKFHMWSGSGGNGKSKLIELFQKTFGDYTTTFPSSLLTKTRAAAETANPHLAAAKGKRFAVLQEPEKGEKLNIGLMKELTGGDKITARGLHRDPIEFYPQFKLVLTCNNKPEVSEVDDGTWRRIRNLEFRSKFVDNPDPNNLFEFHIDDELSRKMEHWPEAFMWILLEEYKEYKKYGINEPMSVKDNTNEYKNNSDPISQFFSEKIKETKGESIHIDEAFTQFLEWYKSAYGSAKPATRKDLQNSMKKKYTKGKHAGILFKNICWDNIGDNDTCNELDI